MKRNSYIMIGLALMLGACGPQATATIDAAQIQASAVALANTMVAETQAAVPSTSTPTETLLPSPTPLPSETPTLVPTLLVDVSPTTPGTDPCNVPFFANPVAAADAGKVKNGANIIITNTTKASVTASLYLSKNDFGQCGYVSYVLPPRQSVTVINVLPFGCYYASAYVNDPKKPTNPSGGPVCITGPDRTTFTISADRIKITGP